ncbi:hypothetical protein [Kitasatospora sp. GAS204B]|uniref:hypothetical protein n=1 Tax=unclassified Kitasatospora TaxID=2633591 RepID=UPI00247484AF|nr:hypothetical protein [Kitasatospora sp. GAS204B]MDH6117879.1 hypothetical protein [Kitasatospora sp. GAS204B]
MPTTDNNNDTAAPPYASAAAPYTVVSPQQRVIWETKGKRAIGFGVAWLLGGLLITVVTIAQAQGGGVYVIAWGPVLYGAYRIFSGVRLRNRSRS